MACSIPFVLKKLNSETDEFENYKKLHAVKVNKSKGTEYLSLGSERRGMTLTFTIVYQPCLKELIFNTQLFVILYKGHLFKVADVDDFMEQHLELKIVCELYAKEN